MCETQECTGVEPLGTVQEADPESPGCSVSGECDWGNYKRQEGPDWSVSLRQSRKGFKCHAIADCLLPVSPAAGYDILTDPEVKQWRQVKVRTSLLLKYLIRNQPGAALIRILLYTFLLLLLPSSPWAVRPHPKFTKATFDVSSAQNGHRLIDKSLDYHAPGGSPEHKIAAQECTYRKVWEDDGNIQKVEVEQSATAFFKTIYTRMHVVQVSHTHAPHRKLAPGLAQGQDPAEMYKWM